VPIKKAAAFIATIAAGTLTAAFAAASPEPAATQECYTALRASPPQTAGRFYLEANTKTGCRFDRNANGNGYTLTSTFDFADNAQGAANLNNFMHELASQAAVNPPAATSPGEIPYGAAVAPPPPPYAYDPYAAVPPPAYYGDAPYYGPGPYGPPPYYNPYYDPYLVPGIIGGITIDELWRRNHYPHHDYRAPPPAYHNREPAWHEGPRAAPHGRAPHR
jgi:hypothetical protein